MRKKPQKFPKKIFEYKHGRISRAGQATFVFFSGFYVLSPIVYLIDRWKLDIIQLVMAIAFFVTLHHWVCSHCPNFGCILNAVPEKDREKFLEAIERGDIY